ncbi:DMT family transporter [Thermomicrobiaceae bacterium CFH 74404]|uniref:DMT family transporter n=1 Tax=Thermalbibacter longus TaxID=2951981 RepID=A0AA41WEM9_9BACT|nr:DMT family transporter [Thermalbibacter longus]MCM8748678.1 DMT family transporter [Thermalbibacter longus]
MGTRPLSGARRHADEASSAHGEQLWGSLAVLLSTVGFGALPTLTKLAYAAGLNVPTLLSFRFGLAALAIWGTLAIRRQARGPGRHVFAFLLLAACFIGNTALFFSSLRYAPATAAAVLFYTYPVVVALLAFIFLREPLTLQRALALALAVLGCAVVLGLSIDVVDARGMVFALASGVVYAAYIVLSSRLLRGAAVAVASAWIMTFMAVAFASFGVATGSLDVSFAPAGWLLLLLIVTVSTVMPVQLFLAGTLRVGPTLASILGTMEPVFAVLFAALVLGERLGWPQAIGGGLIVLAVLLLRLPPSPLANLARWRSGTS